MQISQVALFKELKLSPSNNTCFECGVDSATWASVSFAIFLCKRCAGLHRGLGVHLSFVKSPSMDVWDQTQLRMMFAGGNGPCIDFFRENNILYISDLTTKYSTDAASLYKEKIRRKAESPSLVIPTALLQPQKVIKTEPKNVQNTLVPYQPMTFNFPAVNTPPQGPESQYKSPPFSGQGVEIPFYKNTFPSQQPFSAQQSQGVDPAPLYKSPLAPQQSQGPDPSFLYKPGPSQQLQLGDPSYSYKPSLPPQPEHKSQFPPQQLDPPFAYKPSYSPQLSQPTDQQSLYKSPLPPQQSQLSDPIAYKPSFPPQQSQGTDSSTYKPSFPPQQSQLPDPSSYKPSYPPQQSQGPDPSSYKPSFPPQQQGGDPVAYKGQSPPFDIQAYKNSFSLPQQGVDSFKAAFPSGPFISPFQQPASFEKTPVNEPNPPPNITLLQPNPPKPYQPQQQMNYQQIDQSFYSLFQPTSDQPTISPSVPKRQNSQPSPSITTTNMSSGDSIKLTERAKALLERKRREEKPQTSNLSYPPFHSSSLSSSPNVSLFEINSENSKLRSSTPPSTLHHSGYLEKGPDERGQMVNNLHPFHSEIYTTVEATISSNPTNSFIPRSTSNNNIQPSKNYISYQKPILQPEKPTNTQYLCLPERQTKVRAPRTTLPPSLPSSPRSKTATLRRSKSCPIKPSPKMLSDFVLPKAKKLVFPQPLVENIPSQAPYPYTGNEDREWNDNEERVFSQWALNAGANIHHKFYYRKNQNPDKCIIS